MLVNFGATHFGAAVLGDERRTKRLVRVADRLAAQPGGSLPTAIQDPTELHALYHLMNSPAVTHAAVTAPHFDRTRQAIRTHPDRVILLAHDATDINLTTKRSLHNNLGPLGGSGRPCGYICHTSIAVTTAGQPLGLAGQLLHVNRRRTKTLSRAALRDCPHRQSRLWMAGRAAIGDLGADTQVVDLVDRGGDTFEFLDFEAAHGFSYVARSNHNRQVTLGHAEPASPGPTVGLHSHLRGLPEQARTTLAVSAKPAQGKKPAQAGRTTEVAVNWAAVTLWPPTAARGEHRGGPLPVWAVRVWEPAAPAGATPLEWLLLTSVAVTDAAAAWERVGWYEWRWPAMEEFHKAQKTGCAIEGLHFQSTAAFEPMLGVLSVVAALLMHLRSLSREPVTAAAPAVQFLPFVWVMCLCHWRHGEERRDWTVGEFVLALARLGGHQNRPSDGPPGWQTLWKGWRKLQTALEFAAGRTPE